MATQIKADRIVNSNNQEFAFEYDADGPQDGQGLVWDAAKKLFVNAAIVVPQFTATGGIESMYKDSNGDVWKLHKFIHGESGQFTVTGSGEVEYLIVGGGGGGAELFGGGGGGAVLTGTIELSAGENPVVVGDGGAGSTTFGNDPDGGAGSNGQPSSFAGFTAPGGGGGTAKGAGKNGGTGGGGGGWAAGGYAGGTGNPGGNGGTGASTYDGAGGGGGGAGGNGSNASNNSSSRGAGNGGIGIRSFILGNENYFGGGGGGTCWSSGTFGIGGRGGGGNGGGNGGNNVVGRYGAPSTGGGGGATVRTGSSVYTDPNTTNKGGSGIVAIRYKTGTVSEISSVGSTSANPASSAVQLRDLGLPTGTYWIKDNSNTPHQIFCDMYTAGGGWMSFASIPATGGFFAGNSGTSNWVGKNYSYGTYDSSGEVGNYWRNYSNQTVSEILFRTGNGNYWIHALLSDITNAGGSSATINTLQGSSGNFGGVEDADNKIAVLHRSTQPEDPWINAGNKHATGSDSNNFMFWGETGYTNLNHHNKFKNMNGGVIVFVR